MTHHHLHAATIARLFLAGVLTTLAGATTWAQGFAEPWMNVPSLKSRVDLQAELTKARSDGSMAVWAEGYIEPTKSTKSRAQVLADVTEGRAKGEVY
jgi:hypothetical protein